MTASDTVGISAISAADRDPPAAQLVYQAGGWPEGHSKECSGHGGQQLGMYTLHCHTACMQ